MATTPHSSIPVLLLAALSLPASAGAQESMDAPPPDPVDSYLIEFAGGTVGSLAGLGLGLALARTDECNSEDLGCLLNGVAVGLVTSAVGAAAGAYAAGRWQDTEPSGWGAAIGAVAGAAAGVGVIKLIEETSSGGGVEGFAAVVVYGVAHGLVTAAFSRLF